MGRRRKILFGVLLVVFNLAALELGFYVLSTTDTFIFADGKRFKEVDRLSDFDAYKKFLATGRHDAVLGWNNPQSRQLTRRSHCLKEPYTMTFDERRARISSRKDEVRIVLVGDSFAAGVEVEDHETFGHVLEATLGRRVANHGVGGYGPVQATLLFERVKKLYPDAEIAVLGIMYENILRMVGSYRPAQKPKTGIGLGFKPSVDITGGKPKVLPIPYPQPAETPRELRRRVEEAFRSDFWARPVSRFPYTLSGIRALMKKSVWLKAKEKAARRAKQSPWGVYYRDREMAEALTYVIRRFVTSADAAGMRPLVLFLPLNGRDTVAAREYVLALNAGLGRTVAHDFGQSHIDWVRYAHRLNCFHPSPYGHARIGAFIAEKIRAPISRRTGSRSETALRNPRIVAKHPAQE